MRLDRVVYEGEIFESDLYDCRNLKEDSLGFVLDYVDLFLKFKVKTREGLPWKNI